ncbi:gas vesicle protein [Streptomyces ochraceiscleroticus]|uniref:Gas vesicle protein n=1 Tax=Streptomyces ochraceiscleroticus TaxID=47761 RepID=A0ABW1MUT5_9ACTN|nr:gas vesicle protein [Streptomyces ochraceiscleroticus]
MAEQRRARNGTSSGTPTRRTSAVRGPEKAAEFACTRLEALIGHAPEGASAVRRTEEGWCVVVDALEVARIPDTTSLLASYEVQLDRDGELLEYRRVRRYRRGSADE